MTLLRYTYVLVFGIVIFGCNDTVSPESTSFIKLYGDTEVEEASEMVYSSTLGQYMILGSTSSKVLKGHEGADFDGVILYADTDGNIFDTLVIGGTEENRGKSLSLISDGSLLVGLNVQDSVSEIDGVTNTTTSDLNSFVSILKVSDNKQITFEKTLGYVNDNPAIYGDVLAENSVSDAIEDSDQNILAIGTTNIVDANKEGFNAATDKKDILLLKMDASGANIFARRYGNNGLDEGIGIVERNDGGYLLLASTDRAKLGQDVDLPKVLNILLIYINRNGDIEETLVAGTENNDNPNKIIKREGTDGFVIVGNVSIVGGAGGNDTRGFFMNIFGSRALSDLKLISPILGEGSYRSKFNSIKEFGSSYFVIGSSIGAPQNSDGTSFNSTALNSEQMTLYRLNSAGEQEGDLKFFGWEGDDVGNDLVVTPSNEIVISGTIDFSGDSKVISLIKTNIRGDL